MNDTVRITTTEGIYRGSGLTFSFVLSIIVHGLVVAGMIYFSYRAVAGEKTFVFGRGKVMQVNIFRPGELGGPPPPQTKTTKIKKYEPKEEKIIKKDALPELTTSKKDKKNEMPIKALNAPIGKTATQEATTSGISIGIGTGQAGGIGDGEVFPYAYYVDIIINKLSSNWRVNILKTSKQRTFDAQIWFRISRNGDLLDSRVLQSSGNEDYDNASLHAVSLATPFPPLPIQYEGKTLAFSIMFHYTLD
jgi:TonB family protein